MKKLFFTLLFFIPLFVAAQADLIGKPRPEVMAAMKAANYPFVKLGMTKSKMKPAQLTWYDKFHCGSDAEMFCFYNNSKDDTCRRVRATRNIAVMDSIKHALDSTAVKVKKNTWTDKTGKIKMVLTAYKKYNFIALDYLPADKRSK